MLVYSTGNGVHGFTCDPSLGVFCLSHENMKIPVDGYIYPSTASAKKGKLRLLYECNPMAFLIDKRAEKPATARSGF